MADISLEWAKVSHEGYDGTRSHVEHFRRAFGTSQLNEITPLMLDGYVSRHVLCRTPVTVNRDIVVLRHMLRKTVEWSKVLENPAIHQKRLRADNRRLCSLSRERKDRFRYTAYETLRPNVVPAIHTALRRGELFSLTWPNVDFTWGMLHVMHTKNGNRREIPISATLRETLLTPPRRPGSDQVFPGKTGQGSVDFRKRYHRSLKDSGNKGFVVHDLRHTFASHIVTAGVDLTTAKELLRRTAVKKTLRHAHWHPTTNVRRSAG